MRLVVVAALVLAAGCQDDSTFVSHDLSSPTLYCPTAPPQNRAYPCDPTAIPFCSFPDAQVTCYCTADASGSYALQCPVDLGASD